MSNERGRGVAAAGAILAALVVVGLGFFLNEHGSPEGSGEAGAGARAVPAPPRRTRAARPPVSSRQANPSAPQGSARAEGVLEVEVFSGNTPLADAQVQLYAREPADMSAFPARWTGTAGGDTGADGRWVSPIPPGSYLVTARARDLAPAHAAVVHPPGTARTAVRLRLKAGAELRGFTLVKGTGDPVPLAEILLTPHFLPTDSHGRVDAPEEERFFTTSSETGEFQFSGLAPGRYHIEARSPGYVSRVLPSIPIPFGGPITLDLTPGGQLEGVVIDGEGRPASGAEVLAFNQAHGTVATTDAEGSFSFEVPPGSYTVSARRGLEAGALDGEVRVAVRQRVQGLRLVLRAGARVSGTVVRPDGSPVLGARVELRPQRASFTSGLAGTDANGAFSLQPLAAGTYDVSASSPGGTQLEHGPLTLSAGEHASLALTLPLTL